jgi:HEAT repeats
MKTICLRFGASVLLLLSICSNSIGVRNLRIVDLVKSSDLISVADVTAVTRIGPTEPVLFRDQILQADLYSATLRFRRIIKGSAPPEEEVQVTYKLPVLFVGYRGLSTGTRLVFLRRALDRYTLADPYYPDFPATVATGSAGGIPPTDDVSAVIREMVRVISSPVVSYGEKTQILQVDYALPETEEVVAAFRAGLANSSEPDLKQRLLGELLSRGDLTALPQVVQLLLTNTAMPDQSTWLRYVVANRVNDRRATHDLNQLLRSGDASLRAIAAQAFWHIADPATVPQLSARLEDPDEQVRFYAVKALSDIANEPDWGGPSLSEFQEHEQKYLTHWREWSKNQGRQ